MEDNLEKFIISQKASLIRKDKCLIVEITRRPGLWELPGGRLDKGELRENALLREIKEELNLDRVDVLGVVDYEIWYHKNPDFPFCATVHLIKNNSDEIVLSSENLNYKWITEEEIENYKFLWEVTPRFIKNSFNMYKKIKD